MWSGNSNVVFVGGRDLFRNDNNGTGAWTNLTGSFDGANFGYTPAESRIHPDQHAIAFSPTNDFVTYFGNDGGIYKSTDAGTSNFESLNTSLALTQFVGFDVHPTNDSIMYGGSQDNGTQRRSGADGLTVWQEFANGDGGNVVIDPTRGDRVFATYIQGTILRYTNHGNTESGTLFSDAPDITTNTTFGESATRPRIAFYPPFTSNRTDGALYFGTWRLFVSTDAGATWTPPGGSFDLTNGGSDVLSAIGVQKSGYSNSQTIYTGSSRGRVMVSTDGGANWTQRLSGLPTRFITSIKVSPTDAATAYLTVSGFGTGHVYKTTNSGVSWTNVSGMLPNIPANDIAFWPFDSNILYVATDIGIFISRDAGASWQDYSNGLPPVIVTKLDNLNNGKLFASTYGRGAYEFTIVDCATGLSNYNADAPAAGGGFSVQQTGTAGCPWTAVANDSWITITQGTSGDGPGQITFTVAANAGAAREGTIYLRGGVNTLVLTVRQQGSPCVNALALTPATAEWNEHGGTSFFDVTDGNNNCPRTAISNASWLTVTQGASGTGAGRIVYQVAENNGGAGRRTGSITVNNRTFNVSQD